MELSVRTAQILKLDDPTRHLHISALTLNRQKNMKFQDESVGQEGSTHQAKLDLWSCQLVTNNISYAHTMEVKFS